MRGEKEVLEALAAAGLTPTVHRFGRGTETALSSARELGVDISRIVKSLVFSAQGDPVLALLPGDRRADARAVAEAMGVRKVRLADPDKVLQWSGFPVGAVPPIGHQRKLPILMDEAIPREGDIYPAAGESNNAFRTTFDELRTLTGARVCRISRGE
ncbi:MAG: YbaK/EbsC family protein [bacterium]|nr:MAG: YbaK/EbsC family protein [bacterium]